MRIAGKNIPSEKRLIISLQYIYGVGPVRAQIIMDKAKIKDNVRTKDLTAAQEDLLRKIIEDLGYLVEADLRRSVMQDVKHLQDIGSYRGFRHRRKLPVRGQNTKTNSRTRRGKKQTIANKKKVAK